MQLCPDEQSVSTGLLVASMETGPDGSIAGQRLSAALVADREAREELALRLYRRIAWLRRSDLTLQFVSAVVGTLLILGAFGMVVGSPHPDPARLPLLWTLILAAGVTPLAALAWFVISTWLRDRIQCRIEELGPIGPERAGQDPVSPWVCPGCWESHGAGAPPLCPKCCTPRPSGDAVWQIQYLRRRRGQVQAFVSILSTVVGLMLLFCLLNFFGFFLPRF